MLRRTNTIVLAVTLLFTTISFSQVYNGPATGNVSSGVIVSTNDFDSGALGGLFPEPPQVRKHMDYFPEPSINTGDMEVFGNYTYIEDMSANSRNVNAIGTNFELHSFASIPMTNAVPPDPHMAVGPNNVITMVNGRFFIYDREGNLLKNIPETAWVGQVINHPTISDPQVIYDHYANRWVMLWLTINDIALQSSMTICYSDNENAIGTWYMYSIDGSVNGTTNSSAFGDYPQLGYDDLGVYISSREFFFAGGFAGAKIKILNKSQLYAANGGPITFTDLWNIRDLNGQPTDDLHPTISYDAGNNTAYFLVVPNNSGQSGTYLYKVTNPITTPVLSGVALGITYFYTAPDAQQLGGGTTLSAGGGGSGIRNAPIIRDDSLYAVHHIRNTQDNISTSIKYFVVDVNTNSVVRQVEFGASGFYYIYPSIAVDKDHNVAITYTRSGLTEYAGSYYSTRLFTDPLGFSPSKIMTEGKSNYAIGTSPNRWGDYLGAALDPVNQYNIWLYSEYAAATNQWGTWLTEIRMKPFTGKYTFRSSDSLAFGDVEINTISDTLEVIVANYGTDDLVISDIASNIGPFTLIPDQTFPQTFTTYDSLTVRVIFSPTALGEFAEVLPITSNDPGLTGIILTGNSYEIIQPFTDVFYASSGAGNNGDIITISRETGVGTTVGYSLYSEIKSLTIEPSSNILYGLVSLGINSEIVRVNADQGDSYTLFTLDIPTLSGIDFDTSGTLYVSSQSGDIYSIDQTNGNYTLVTSVGLELNAIAFNPTTNVLWGARRVTFGLGKDSLYTIDLTTGAATPVGKTGFGASTNDMAFDEADKLYGVRGVSNQAGKLFEINQVDGVGTLIGTGVGFNHTLGLAFSINGIVSSVAGNESAIPDEFALKQNYPNPFNPSTKITFSLPVNSNVKIIVYNLLGEVVRELTNTDMNAGTHSVQWNANDISGKKVSSGIYFYELSAAGVNGNQFNQVRKMILLK